MRRAVELLHEHRVPWRPVGRGGDPGAGLHLSTQRLGEVVDLWREDLVARIAAGCSLQDAQRILAQEGLRVPATAIGPEHDTLGLLFATGQRGWRSAPNRALRECTLGLTVIDGAARVLKGGGRVVKNVAGFDLVRLHHGAGGAFGILTDLVVKLEALPEAGVELALPCSAHQVPRLLEACREASRGLDPVAQLWCDGGASGVVGLGTEGAILLQAEGWAESLQTWGDALPAVGVTISIQDLQTRLEAASAWHGRWQVGTRCALEQGAPVLQRWRERGLGVWMMVDLLAGGAVLYAEDPQEPLCEVLDELLALGGQLHSAVEHPLPSGMRPRAPLSAELRLKASFDPIGLLPEIPLPLERSA